MCSANQISSQRRGKQDEIRKEKKEIDNTRKGTFMRQRKASETKRIRSLEKEINEQKKKTPPSPLFRLFCLVVWLLGCLAAIAEVLCLQDKKRGKCNHSNKSTTGRGRKKSRVETT